MEKFLQKIEEAEKTIRIADHIAYVTFPIVKDKRLLLKIMLETKNAIANCINSILQYEYLYKRIKLYQNPSENFRIFTEKCAPRYNITKDEVNLINELFDFAKKHKESSMEFVRREKVVILTNSMEQRILTIEKTKGFILLAKNILSKIKDKFSQP